MRHTKISVKKWPSCSIVYKIYALYGICSLSSSLIMIMADGAVIIIVIDG